LSEFDPGSSNREKRKLKSKSRPVTTLTSKSKPAVYDDKGILIHVQKDLCDCLEDECPGNDGTTCLKFLLPLDEMKGIVLFQKSTTKLMRAH